MAMSLLIVVLFGAATFVALGWWSRSGKHTPAGIAGTTRLTACGPAPNCVCSEGDATTDPAHWVAPIVWPTAVAPAQREPLLRAAIEQLGGRIEKATPDYMHATFTSRIFGFVDDLELRLLPAQVEVRSASRVGHSDLGANRKRVEALRSVLSAGQR